MKISFRDQISLRIERNIFNLGDGILSVMVYRNIFSNFLQPRRPTIDRCVYRRKLYSYSVFFLFCCCNDTVACIRYMYKYACMMATTSRNFKTKRRRDYNRQWMFNKRRELASVNHVEEGLLSSPSSDNESVCNVHVHVQERIVLEVMRLMTTMNGQFAMMLIVIVTIL